MNEGRHNIWRSPVTALLVVGCAWTAPAFADFIVGDATTSTGEAETNLTFQAENNIAQFTVDLFFDPAALEPLVPAGALPQPVNGCLDSSGANWDTVNAVSCNKVGENQIRINLATGFAANVPLDPGSGLDGLFGSISWNVTGNPGDVFPITVEIDAVSIDGSPAPNSALTVVEGSVTVQAEAGEGFYASTPVPGSELNLGSAVIGSEATPVDSLTVENLSPDTAFDIEGFNGPTTLTFPATPQTVAAGATAEQNISCTPATVGDNDGSFSVDHDSMGGAAPPVSYDFSCIGLAPNVDVPDGPIEISGLTADAGPPTQTVTVTNQGEFASDAGGVMASASGDPEISVAPAGPLTISAGGSQNFTVSCNNDVDGDFTSTVTITWEDPSSGSGTTSDTFDVQCNITDAAPELSSDPAAPGPLDFGDPVINGTESEPIGIDVFNSGTGPSPESDLTITEVSASAGFSATINNSGPFLVGGSADGNADIEVVCAPPVGSSGTLTGTLTVTHDGQNSPTEFDLSCESESSANLAVIPESAVNGTLNLGSVAPGTTTTGQLTLSNTGSDPLEVSCTLSDDNGGVITAAALPDGAILPPDFVINFEGTPPEIGSVEETLECFVQTEGIPVGAEGGTGPTFTTRVIVSGRVLAIPTLSQLGLLVLMLSLLLVGGFAARRVMG